MNFLQLSKAKMSSNTKVIWFTLCSLCNDENPWHCYPSQSWLADHTNMSVRTVQNCVKDLERIGLIKTEKNNIGTLTYRIQKEAIKIDDIFEYREDKGRFAPKKEASLITQNLHTQNIPTQPVTQNVHRPASKSAYGTKLDLPKVLENNIPRQNLRHAKSADNIRNKNLNTIPPLPPKVKIETKVLHKGCVSFSLSSPTKQKNDALQAFEKVWNLWPRKEAKERAQKMWLIHWRNKALPNIAELQAKIQSYIPSVSEARYIPYFGSWLYDKRWQDNGHKSEHRPMGLSVSSFVPKPIGKTEQQKQQEELALEAQAKIWRARQNEQLYQHQPHRCWQKNQRI